MSTLNGYFKKVKKRVPFADDAVKIAQVLDTTVEYLVTGEGLPTIEKPDPEMMELCRLLRGVPAEKIKAVLTLVGKEPDLGRGSRDDSKAVAG